MPKGRGAQERHRNPRQKRAAWINRYGDKGMVARYYDRRKRRIAGGVLPKTVGRHPLARSR